MYNIQVGIPKYDKFQPGNHPTPKIPLCKFCDDFVPGRKRGSKRQYYSLRLQKREQYELEFEEFRESCHFLADLSEEAKKPTKRQFLHWLSLYFTSLPTKCVSLNAEIIEDAVSDGLSSTAYTGLL